MSFDSEYLQWPPRNSEEVKVWLNARLDGECTPEQEGWLADYLQTSPECSREWAALERTRIAFETARLKEPSDFEIEQLSKSLGPTLLNDVGWVLLILGGVVLAGYGAYLLWTDVDTPAMVRLGIGAFVGGLLLLLGRVSWERLRVMKTDPYREVRR